MTTQIEKNIKVSYESPRKRFLRRFRQDKVGVVAAVFLLCVIIFAIVGPMLAPHDPNAQNLNEIFAEPSAQYLLGTDELGRDYFSRMIVASQATLFAGVAATGISLVIGLPFGLIAGYSKGVVDGILSRINDAVMAVPALLLAIALVAFMGPSVTTAVIAIGFANIPRFFRVARGSSLIVREQTFVEAARSVGVSNLKNMFSHVLPNIASPLIVQVSMTVGFSILFEAGLSFLGLGVQAPDASWGSMLRNATQYASHNIGLVLWPGLAILLTVLAFNALGDTVRDSIGREIRKF